MSSELLKAPRLKRENMSVAGKRVEKQVLAATNAHICKEELL
jgi:hypothetical protein